MNNEVAQHVRYPLPTYSNCAKNADSNSQSVTTDALWKPENRVYQRGVVGLHSEIMDFVDFIAPKPAEHWVREVVVSKVRNIILSMWPECRFFVFGSFATSLYLPTSDIDVVVCGKWAEIPLRTVEIALRNSRMASEIKVLSKATVPIVKITDAVSGLRVDISFNMYSSVRAVDFISRCMVKYPCLRYLVFTLKQFLFQRELNEVWTGGISSYGLILMCISFLQQHVKEGDTPETVNLGTLLVEFFELYGRNFNYLTTAIRVAGNGSYVRKDAWQKSADPYSSPSILCIEDPLMPGNNVGKRSYAALQARQAFEYAYVVLSSALRSDAEFDGSILSKIIQVSSTTVECRNRLQSTLDEINRILPSLIVPTVSPYRRLYCSPHSGTNGFGNEASTGQKQPKNSPQLSKEPIVVSVRGYSTRPANFLRMPNDEKMMSITGHPPPFVYPQQPVFCKPVLLPNSMPIVPGTAPVEPFLLLFHPHNHAIGQPVFQGAAPASSLDSGSNDESECDERLSESDSRSRDSLTPESKWISRDSQQHFNDRNLKYASNLCSGLANQLAPLRLVCSERNVSSVLSQTEPDTKLVSESLERVLTNSASPVAQEPQQPSRTKGGRRRTRPVRRAADNSEVPSISPQVLSEKPRQATNGLAPPYNPSLSSNEESESSTGSQTVHGFKRHCSQILFCGNKPASPNSSVRADSGNLLKSNETVKTKYSSLPIAPPSNLRQNNISCGGNGHEKKQPRGNAASQGSAANKQNL